MTTTKYPNNLYRWQRIKLKINTCFKIKLKIRLKINTQFGIHSLKLNLHKIIIDTSFNQISVCMSSVIRVKSTWFVGSNRCVNTQNHNYKQASRRCEVGIISTLRPKKPAPWLTIQHATWKHDRKHGDYMKLDIKILHWKLSLKR